MFIDLIWVGAATVGITMALLDSRYGGAFIWLAFGLYALMNYLNHKLRGKYDV